MDIRENVAPTQTTSTIPSNGREGGGAEVHSVKARFSAKNLEYGGESGIRTHGELSPTAVFKTAALNHSAISPVRGSIMPHARDAQARA